MRSELAGQASGVASVVTYATSKGYDVTPAEVSTYIQGQVAQELTDGQLDAIAGGKGHHHRSSFHKHLCGPDRGRCDHRGSRGGNLCQSGC